MNDRSGALGWATATDLAFAIFAGSRALRLLRRSSGPPVQRRKITHPDRALNKVGKKWQLFHSNRISILPRFWSRE
jgi:hypothetical protein